MCRVVWSVSVETSKPDVWKMMRTQLRRAEKVEGECKPCAAICLTTRLAWMDASTAVLWDLHLALVTFIRLAVEAPMCRAAVLWGLHLRSCRDTSVPWELHTLDINRNLHKHPLSCPPTQRSRRESEAVFCLAPCPYGSPVHSGMDATGVP